MASLIQDTGLLYFEYSQKILNLDIIPDIISNMKILPVITLLFFMHTTVAQPVEYPSAKKMARQFLDYRIKDASNNLTFQIDETYVEMENNEPVLYVFKLLPAGFIIISGDYRAIPVLGYSFESVFDETRISPALSQWLDYYVLEIQSARKDYPNKRGYRYLWSTPISSNLQGIKEKTGNGVNPLLNSIWEQGRYYNSFCPENPEKPGEHCPAGCVALAQAQVMYYFRHPIRGDSSITYTNIPTQDSISVDFGNATYKWDEMVNHISGMPNTAIAELIFHSGASVETYYSPDGSGSHTLFCEKALKTHFRYDTNVVYYERGDTSISWKELLIGNLNNLQPVIYKGGAWPSHCFVCDGYQDSSYFHFNFGFWIGSGNGYYMIDDITPFHYDFSYHQAGVFNIFPAGDYPHYASDTDTLTTWRGSLSDGSGPMPYLENTDAYWLISPEGGSDSTVIMLYFDDFNTEPDQDMVTVYDGDNTSSKILGSFSGNTIPPTISSTGNKMLVHFHSNGNLNAEGWLANYTAVNRQFCQVYAELSDTSAFFGDGSGIVYDYANNTNCQWLIKPCFAGYDSISGIMINFDEFSSEAEKDYLRVYNGSTIQAPVLLEWSGNGIPEQVVSTSDEVLIEFQSDMIGTQAGFSGHYNLYFPEYCSDTTVITHQSGTFGDGSGIKNYVNNTDCYWHIKPSQKDTIILTFKEFDLEYGYDWVKIIDPLENPPAMLGQFTGNKIPPTVTSGKGELLIHFHTDFCDNAPGWEAEFVTFNQAITENERNNSILVFPNPAGDVINVELISKDSGKAILDLVSPKGEVVLSSDIDIFPGENRVLLNSSSLPDGLYTIVLKTFNERFINKIIISH